jgi:hypothetical protein
MGIRFFCPNGHKLNVKEFQAGQKGICPFCGVKMDIPLESTRPSSSEPPQRPSDQTPPTPATTAAAPSIGSSAVATFAPVDPLTESGRAVWYVRPAAGGQFGPAAAEVMRTWLTEGRIGADTLVWHEGWRDWREAGDVFAQPMPEQAVPGLENIYADSTEAPAISPSVSPSRSRFSVQNRSWILIGALVSAVLILSVVLILVLKKT